MVASPRRVSARIGAFLVTQQDLQYVIRLRRKRRFASPSREEGMPVILRDPQWLKEIQLDVKETPGHQDGPRLLRWA